MQNVDVILVFESEPSVLSSVIELAEKLTYFFFKCFVSDWQDRQDYKHSNSVLKSENAIHFVQTSCITAFESGSKLVRSVTD